jgi:hypothetical protein
MGVVVVLATFVCADAPAAAQSAPAKAAAMPRAADGKPDLSGFWDIPSVMDMSMGNEEEVPYTSMGRAAFRNHDAKDNPTGFCLPPGVPRIMQSPFPMAIVQTPGYVVMLFEYQRIWRMIYTDGRAHHTDVADTFLGDSIGKWEGDTLVIDTVALNDRTWLDAAGHQHSANLHVIERLTRTGPDTMAYVFTVDDPAMYAKPWIHERVFKTLKPSKGLPDLIEYSCNDHNVAVPHLVSTKPAAGSH